MAAKKKTAAKKASTSSKASTAAVPTPTRTVQTSDDVLAVEEPKRAQPPQGERAEPTPTIEDPTLSSDNRHSTYVDANDKFPADTGNQVEEIPGKPKSER